METKAIPKDHPYRRDFARLERDFGDAMAVALDRWRLALFRGVSETNVHQLVMRLDDPELTNIVQDVLTQQLQAIAVEGVDKAREQVEKEVFGVS